MEQLEELIAQERVQELIARLKRTTSIPLTQARRAITTNSPYQEARRAVADAAAKAATEHLRQRHYLISGELILAGSEAYGCERWEFKDHIINQGDKDVSGSFKQRFKEQREERYQKALVGDLVGDRWKRVYKEIVNKKQKVWYDKAHEEAVRTDIRKEYFTPKPPGKRKKKEKRPRREDAYQQARQAHPTTTREEAPTAEERPKDADAFAERYGLSGEASPYTIKNERFTIDRFLYTHGLGARHEQEREELRRRTIRGGAFEEMIKGKEEGTIDERKLGQLATLYKDRHGHEFREDLNAVFGELQRQHF
ncbi:hypothetical protein JXA12_03975 [Candidatus Woesearchaeota archaeon]|nr:hypothetical protein [Candidatus Woesearchaeota archaeon]